MSELTPPEGTLLATVNGVEYRLLHAVFAVRRRKWTPYCSEQDWNHSSVAADVRRQERIAELEAELAALKGTTGQTSGRSAGLSAMNTTRHPCPACGRLLAKRGWVRHITKCTGSEAPPWPVAPEPEPATPEPEPESEPTKPIESAVTLDRSAQRVLATLRDMLVVGEAQTLRVRDIVAHPQAPGESLVRRSLNRLLDAQLLAFESAESRGYTITLLPAALHIPLPGAPAALLEMSVDEAQAQLAILEDEERELCALKWRTVAQVDRLKAIAAEKAQVNDALRRARAQARQSKEQPHAAAA